VSHQCTAEMPGKRKASVDRHSRGKLSGFLLSAALLSLGFAPNLPFANTIEAPSQVQSDVTLQSILAEALRSASSIPDLAEKASTYNSIAMVEWQIGSTKKAQQHFDLAHRLSLHMSRDDLTCLIRRGMNEERASAGDLEGALRNLSDCGPDSQLTDEQDNISVNMARYEVKSGNFVHAMTLIQSIRQPDVRDAALAYDAQIAASGDLEEALAFANSINEIALRITTLSQIAGEYVKRGQSEKAVHVIQKSLLAASEIPAWKKPTGVPEEIARLEPNPDWMSYNTIAVAFADSSAFPQAIATAEHFLDGEEKEWVLMQIAFCAARQGRPDVLDEVNLQLRDPVLSKELTAAQAEALARSGNQKRALEIAENAPDLTTEADSFAGLAAVAFDAGDHASAESFSAKSALLADAISDHRSRSALFWRLAGIQIKGKDNADAVKSLSRVSPEDVGWRMLAELARDHVRAGDVTGALKLADHPSRSSRVGLLNDIASEQSKLGDDAGALSWIETLISPDEKAQGLLGVAQGILARTSQ
jgi:tetratricopeptide (TPR) repeat protein